HHERECSRHAHIRSNSEAHRPEGGTRNHFGRVLRFFSSRRQSIESNVGKEAFGGTSQNSVDSTWEEILMVAEVCEGHSVANYKEDH
ncbi:hypothetical protein PMAYCL1PPCAC_05580, partial [Pristionchus mayeri]